MNDADAQFLLRDVQDIVVIPIVQLTNDTYARAGVTGLIATSTNPPLTALVVRRPHGVMNLFPFTDADLADRVVKALTHAVELCGDGSKPEPF
jgi:hypothetical protein